MLSLFYLFPDMKKWVMSRLKQFKTVLHFSDHNCHTLMICDTWEMEKINFLQTMLYFCLPFVSCTNSNDSWSKTIYLTFTLEISFLLFQSKASMKSSNNNYVFCVLDELYMSFLTWINMWPTFYFSLTLTPGLCLSRFSILY